VNSRPKTVQNIRPRGTPGFSGFVPLTALLTLADRCNPRPCLITPQAITQPLARDWWKPPRPLAPPANFDHQVLGHWKKMNSPKLGRRIQLTTGHSRPAKISTPPLQQERKIASASSSGPPFPAHVWSAPCRRPPLISSIDVLARNYRPSPMEHAPGLGLGLRSFIPMISLVTFRKSGACAP